MAEEVASDYGLEHYNELFIRRRRMLGTVPANAHNQFHDFDCKKPEIIGPVMVVSLKNCSSISQPPPSTLLA